MPSPDVLEAWCGACSLDDDHCARLAQVARSADGPVPNWFQDWLDAERHALTLRLWQPIIVPGLLQTADYARALFMSGQTDTSDDAIDALVAARIGRQALLNGASPPDVLVVLDELVLRPYVSVNQDGPRLTVPSEAWRALTRRIQRGQ